MENEIKKPADAVLLRLKAEELLKEKRAKKSVSLTQADTVKLLYELEVHQIELEIQNEELQVAKVRAETNAEKYTNLYNFAPSRCFTLDSIGRILELNLNGASMLGRDRLKLTNSKFSLFVSTDTRPVFNTFFSQLFKTQTSQSCEVQLYIKGKLSLFVHLDGVVSDNSRQCLLTAVDITKRKQAEKKLKESKNLLHKVIDNTPNSIYIKDREGYYIIVNHKMAELHNTTPEAIVGTLDSDLGKKFLTSKEKVDKFRSAEQEVIDNKQALFIPEEEFTFLDGTKRWFQTTKLPISIKNNPNCLMTVAIDITDRKQAEEELKLNRILLRNVLDIVPVFICAKNIDGKFILVNKKLADFYGSTVEAITNVNHAELCEDKNKLHAMLADDREVIESGKYKFISEETMENPDGSITVLETYKIPFTALGEPAVLIASNDITKRKQAVEEIKENEKKFRELFDNGADAIFIADIETGIIVDANQTASRLMQKPVKQIVGLHQARLHPENNMESAKDTFTKHKQELQKHNQTVPVENMVVRADGTLLPIEITAAKITLKGKSYIMGTFHDISIRKQAEEELLKAKEKAEESEQSYISLFNSVTEAIYIQNKDGVFIDVNDGVYKMYGYTREEVIGKTPEMLAAPNKNDMSHSFSLVKKVFETGNPERYEFWGIRKNGEIFPKEVITNKLEYFGKDAIITTARDITERKKSELEIIKAKEKAEESESIYLKLFSEIPDGVYKSSHEGTFIDVNLAMAHMLGYSSKEELLKVDIKNDLYFDVSDRESLSLDSIKKELGVFRMRKKDGSEIWVEDHGWYTLDDLGNILYHEGVLRDVTDRIRGEQELFAAKNRAEESDRLKSAFLANMSHEIRTPMNGILGFADLLKEPGLTGEEQQKYIGIIEKGGARMLNIINDIISISKIESGQMEVNIQDSNINEQIEYIYTFFKPEIEGKGMQFSFKNALSSKDALLKTDREKVFAILTNLVKNAIKYSEKGSIEVGYNEKPDFLEFYVKDTGIGIPEDRHKAIFERFIQADITDKMARQGAGLGLSISRAYVEMLDGKIWVESEVGKGSTFYFTLPYHTETVIENSAKNEILLPAEDDSINKLKILIVEDDETSKMLISIVAQKFGSKIFSIRTGTEAVEVCRKNPDIDLVLMDIQLPKMNGYEATRQIRKFNKDIIIIAQTAYALVGDREKAIAAGCDDYISKPIKAAVLKQMIVKYLNKK